MAYNLTVPRRIEKKILEQKLAETVPYGQQNFEKNFRPQILLLNFELLFNHTSSEEYFFVIARMNVIYKSLSNQRQYNGTQENQDGE